MISKGESPNALLTYDILQGSVYYIPQATRVFFIIFTEYIVQKSWYVCLMYQRIKDRTEQEARDRKEWESNSQLEAKLCH